MICPQCVMFRNANFCKDCGAPTQKHDCCGCGNCLTATQKFCEKCGAKCLPFIPEPPVTSAPVEMSAVDRACEIADRAELPHLPQNN